MNGKKNTQKKARKRNNLYGMLLLMFISVVGYIISKNPICFIGILYASAKIIIILRPILNKIYHNNTFSNRFIVTYALLWTVIASMVIALMLHQVWFIFILFMVSLYLVCFILLNYEKESRLLQKIIETKAKEKIHEYITYEKR